TFVVNHSLFTSLPPPISTPFPYTTLFRSVGLAGVQNTPRDSFDEDPKLNQVIAAKMSKSKPENNILIHDEPEVIGKKIQQAFCRSEEHTSELQSRGHLVCRLLLEKKKE